MKALVKNDFIVFEAPRIELGIYDEPFEKWALMDENGKIMMYAVNDDFELIEYDESKKPADYEPYKYFFTGGEFTINDKRPTPVKSDSERIVELEAEIAELKKLIQQ